VVLSAALRVLDHHGEAGYLEAWHLAPFPHEPAERLAKALDRSPPVSA
jgi:hypothetical protein